MSSYGTPPATAPSTAGGIPASVAPYAFPYPVASLVSRFGATVIDFLVLIVLAAVVAIPLGIFTAATALAWGGTGPWVQLLWGPFTLVMFLVWFLYFTYFESTTGQTLGKRLLGLRVIYVPSGRPPDFAHATVRNVLRFIDWLPAFYLVGFVLALTTPKRQRLGDVLAETVVARA